MMLELTPKEAEELGNALESYLKDLRMEIAGTDSWEYRQSLKERRALFDRMLGRIRPSAIAAARVSTGDST